MKGRHTSTADTRGRLLAAASEVFADRGYREATVSEICRRAGANIAAVNYHFGDKATLYAEAWRHGLAKSLQAHPPDGGVGDDAPAEERFRGAVTSFLHRIADEDNREFRIVLKERANPTGLLREVMRKDLRPQFLRMEAIVGDLLGRPALDEQVRYCVISVISQCIDPIVMAKSHPGGGRKADGPPDIGDVAVYADHVVRFSLAGIAAAGAAGRRARPMAAKV